MRFLLLLVGTSVACVLLRRPIARMPWVFYLLALAIDIAFFASTIYTFPHWARVALTVTMQKGGLGVALFVIVMYIGVFPRQGTVSHWLRPIRAELSIISCILIAGHMCIYMSHYLPNILAGSILKNHVMAAFVVSLALLVLVLLLGITSFRFVKKHMKARTWKRIQNLAYVFYLAIFVHMILMIGPSALQKVGPAFVNVVVYIAVFGVYVIARIWRAVVDKREQVDQLAAIMDQGFVE